LMLYLKKISVGKSPDLYILGRGTGTPP